MYIKFRVDRAACFAKGVDTDRDYAIVDVDPASLTQEQRDWFVTKLKHSEPNELDQCMTYTYGSVPGNTASDLLAEIDREAAKKKAAEEEKANNLAKFKNDFDEAFKSRKTQCYQKVEYGGGIEVKYSEFSPDLPYSYMDEGRAYAACVKKSPEYKQWEEALKELNESEKNRAKKLAEAAKAKQAEEEDARRDQIMEWAANHGSDLLKSRIENGFEYEDLAKEEFANWVSMAVFEQEFDCWFAGGTTAYTEPSLSEIEALLEAKRKASIFGRPVSSVELVLVGRTIRTTYLACDIDFFGEPVTFGVLLTEPENEDSEQEEEVEA